MIFGENFSDNDSQDEDEQNVVSTTSALTATIRPNLRITSTRAPADFFKESERLLEEGTTATKPFRSFSIDSTAIHLPCDPTITRNTVDNIAQLFNLSDFRGAIGDYLQQYQPNKTYAIGGCRLSAPDCKLPFTQLQVFCKICI